MVKVVPCPGGIATALDLSPLVGKGFLLVGSPLHARSEILRSCIVPLEKRRELKSTLTREGSSTLSYQRFEPWAH